MDKDAAPDKPKHESVSPATKKPYVKPSFEFDRTFETMALSCGKIHGERFCKHQRKRS